MASSGGGYNSVTSSEPWKGQSKFLTPIFQSALYGTTGRSVNPDYDPNDPNNNEPKFETGNDVNSLYRDFFDPDYAAPGKLDYFGATNPQGQGQWDAPVNRILNLTDTEKGAPTIAEFTDAQKKAQTATENLANQRIGNQNSLLGKSETGLGNIISGGNKIPYHDIGIPQISDPGDISRERINYNPNMQAADVNYNPAMQAANLNYGYSNDLGNVASGGGGNQYLDDMITAATRGINRNFKNNVIPDINSAAESAGARGSDTWEDLRTAANQDYLTSIGDVEANIRGNAFDNQLNARMQALGLGKDIAGMSSGYTQEANKLNTQFSLEKALAESGYGQEANRLNTQFGLEKATTEAGYGQEANVQNVMNDLQRYFEQAGITSDINKQNALLKTQTDTQNIDNILQAMGFAPDINQAGYNDIGALAASGAEQQQMNQDVLNAYIQMQEQGQMEPWNRASLFSQLIGGNFGGTVTQSAQQKGGK